MATEARNSTGTLEDKPPWRTKAYVLETWPPPREVAPAELKKEDFNTNAECGEGRIREAGQEEKGQTRTAENDAEEEPCQENEAKWGYHN
ncbi:unnamed protein product [Peronospora destructor]|uniref:Uncharacterized protein n=1 Tax=Peronospora destructor TaxID=86335 RepID=A0AAV0TYH1_9STRA|nr:unnamed protein product [Peronospora destructor]